jgi:polyisoprenoid-binding protein YceI
MSNNNLNLIKMKTIQSILAAIMIMASVGIMAQKVEVDTDNSSLEWLGKKVTGEHSGTIQLKEGHLMMKGEKLTGGEILIDMNSIVNTDIEDAEYKAKLEGHLKSDDFFGVEKFPTAKLVIKKSSAFKNNKATVKGELTIKETTLPVEFEVEKMDGKMKAVVIVDRSKYDIRYGSGSFFDGLGDKMIYDDFTLMVELATK